MVDKTLAGVFAILCISAPLAARAQSSNPYEADPTAIRAGHALYANRCADCHAADAKGATGPDLTLLWASGTNDERVFETIRRGVEGSVMPPSFAPDNEIWAVVAYLRNVSTVPPFESSGDTEQGREIFASTCTRCHRVSGNGGTLGPDLSRIAEIRSREALVNAIRDPSESVAVRYRAVTLVTRDGERIEGLVKSEDAFSIQIVDTDERLQGYLKADLEEVIHETQSVMPRLGRVRLSNRKLEHLLAFLSTLREPDSAGGPDDAQ